MSYLYQLDDGRAVETVQEWKEQTRFDGKNYVGCFTDQEFRQADLGRTKTGLWVILPGSNYQGAQPKAYEISAEEAAGWFAANREPLPDELEEVVL